MPASQLTFDQIDLADSTRELLGKDLATLAHPAQDIDYCLTRLHQIFAQLPIEQLQHILDFGRHADTAGVMLVRNLPVDERLPATPVDGSPSNDKQTFVAEGVLLGLTSLLGEPVGFTTEKAGNLIHDVVPVADGAMTQTNQGSLVFLNFHNDIVHDDLGRYNLSNPDFLVLSCLRQDPAGEAVTYYADARDMCAGLSPETVEALRKPEYMLNAPGSYVRDVAGGVASYSEPVALITGPENAPEVSVSANGVKPLTPAAASAFEALQAACHEVAHKAKLAPGTALLINNRKGLHARSPFPARHDGTDRWLQRTYVRRDLWNIRYRAIPGTRRTH